jgi:hypothetical protein
MKEFYDYMEFFFLYFKVKFVGIKEGETVEDGKILIELE